MTNQTRLPEGPLIAFYGDDFTGSSAIMEVLAFAGLRALMFVEPPSTAQLRRFSAYRAIGIASVARAQPPSWMDVNLPSAFQTLAESGAPIVHYKVCSTLDSSSNVGSIGRAVDIGASLFGKEPSAATWHPLIVAAPPIGRYQAFGNLFAKHNDSIHRLDRHPVMRSHPVTPMDEADVRLHLARQTTRAIGLIDLAAMKNGFGFERFKSELGCGRRVISLDVVDDDTLRWVGALMWENRGRRLFAIGSQGVEYALLAHWRAMGLLPSAAGPQPATKERQIIAVSGSVSPVTAGQIDWAAENGFDVIAVEAEASLDESAWAAELERAVGKAVASLSRGRSPLVATAHGYDGEAVAKLRRKLSAVGLDPATASARIGAGLGGILKRLAGETGVKRGAVLGGDTSGFAVRALDAYALEAIAPIAPGAPLCRIFSSTPGMDGFEIALKGGQMGEAGFLGTVRAGGAAN